MCVCVCVARVALVGHPVLLQERLNHRSLLGCHRPDNDVLVAREPEVARVDLRKEVVIACACQCVCYEGRDSVCVCTCVYSSAVARYLSASAQSPHEGAWETLRNASKTAVQEQRKALHTNAHTVTLTPVDPAATTKTTPSAPGSTPTRAILKAPAFAQTQKRYLPWRSHAGRS